MSNSCDPMDSSLACSSVLGISQARILERVAISFSSWFSWPRDWTCVSCIGRQVLHHKTTSKAHLYECCSVAQSCLALRDPMDCSTVPVLHYLPEFAQTHAYWDNHAIQPSHPLSSPSPPAFSLSQHQLGSFPMRWLFASGGQSIGTSALASVLPVNIQGWFPLRFVVLRYKSNILNL